MSEDADYDSYALPPDAIQEPPTSLLTALRKIGPGIILAGTIVGSGELLLTTRFGAIHGFIFLWLILFSCIIKVFVQTELGRYAISSGKPTLGALNELGGPRFGAQWIVWGWLFMMLCTILQLGAMTGTVGQSLNLAFPSVSEFISDKVEGIGPTQAKVNRAETEEAQVPRENKASGGSGAKLNDDVPAQHKVQNDNETFRTRVAKIIRARPEYPWAVLTCLTAIGLLWSGSYRRIETITTFLVVSLTIVTVTATCSLPLTKFQIPWDQVAKGLEFQMPAAGIATAFAVFGITGVGAAELFYYPYWCLEKGYARCVGVRDDSEDWLRRAKGWIRVMYLDAWVSMVVFTISTVAFYFMGATVLHPQNLHPKGKDMILTLSRMFVDSIGPWTQIAFLIGAGAVLFKTLYLSCAGNARLIADFLSLSGAARYQKAAQRSRVIHWVSLSIPVVALALFFVLGEPASMVAMGGFAQAMMLPIISGSTIYFRYRKLDHRMKPPLLIDILLWVAFISITIVAIVAMHDQALNLIRTMSPGEKK